MVVAGLFITSDGLIYNTVQTIAQDSSGNIWFGTLIGASKFDGEKWESFTGQDKLPYGYVTSIDVDNKGGVWIGCDNRIGTGDGISKFDGTTWDKLQRLAASRRMIL